MEIRHFYHLAADLGWEEPAAAHAAAVRRAGLPGQVIVSVTGRPAARADVRAWLALSWPAAAVTEHDAATGSEAVTLALARGWALEHPDGAVLYCHAKGSSHPGAFTDAWRESMTIDVAGGWKDCAAALESGEYDAAGPHWLDPAAFPGMAVANQENGGSVTPYFGGNFWWAASSYLARLPEPDPDGTRWDAERWIGTGWPRVLNLRPGWPNLMLFTGNTAVRLLRGW